MLTHSFILAKKDLKLVLLGGQGLVQAGLLGLLLIFVFSLAAIKGGQVGTQWIAAIFWLASCFALILIFNTLYSLEEKDESRLGLILAPIPLQAIWLGKGLAGFLLLLMVQILFMPAIVVFLGVGSIASWSLFFLSLLLLDWGLVTIGSLLGALGEGGGDSLLAVIVLPLLIPLLLAGIRIGGLLIGKELEQDFSAWLKLVGAFDALYTGLAMILFPFVYSE